jgi:septal ring factor EnvC (AmiA/AmiB activator)
MKYLLALTFVFVSCTSTETKTSEDETNSAIDSIISKNQETITTIAGANKKSDSIVTGKVEHTVKKITNLETQVKELKQENNELKAQIDDIDDAGKPYSIKSISNN